MKWMTVITACLLLSSNIEGQSLQGTWTGYFEEKGLFDIPKEYKYSLIFSKKGSDTVYSAISITTYEGGKGRIDTIACNVKGWNLTSRLFHLEEVDVIKNTTNLEPSTCGQIMEMTLRETKKKMILEGQWWGAFEDCGGGKIYLIKQQ